MKHIKFDNVYKFSDLAQQFKCSKLSSSLWGLHVKADDIFNLEYIEGSDGLYIITEEYFFVKLIVEDD